MLQRIQFTRIWYIIYVRFTTAIYYLDQRSASQMLGRAVLSVQQKSNLFGSHNIFVNFENAAASYFLFEFSRSTLNGGWGARM